MAGISVPPGYNIVPSQLFGQFADLSFWNGIIPAGQGPVTAPAPISPEVACLRSAPSPFNICARKEHAW